MYEDDVTPFEGGCCGGRVGSGDRMRDGVVIIIVVVAVLCDEFRRG